MSKVKWLLGLLFGIFLGVMFLLFIIFFGLLVRQLYLDISDKYEYVTEVNCVITDKNYESGYTYIIPCGDSNIINVEPDEYNVKVEYNYDDNVITYTFDSEDIYNKYNVGDNIKMDLYKDGKDKYKLEKESE